MSKTSLLQFKKIKPIHRFYCQVYAKSNHFISSFSLTVHICMPEAKDTIPFHSPPPMKISTGVVKTVIMGGRFSPPQGRPSRVRGGVGGSFAIILSRIFQVKLGQSDSWFYSRIQAGRFSSF